MDMDDLYDLMDWCEEEDSILIHRGPGNHVSVECWCYPLELPIDYIMGANPEELQQVVDEYFRVH